MKPRFYKDGVYLAMSGGQESIVEKWGDEIFMVKGWNDGTDFLPEKLDLSWNEWLECHSKLALCYLSNGWRPGLMRAISHEPLQRDPLHEEDIPCKKPFHLGNWFEMLFRELRCPGMRMPNTQLPIPNTTPYVKPPSSR